MPDARKRRLWKLLLRQILRMGRFKAVLCITLTAEIMAVTLDWVLLRLSPFPVETYRASLTMAFLIPLLVAPVIGGVIVTLLQQLEESRTVLEEMASRDGLTMLFNRTYFMDLLRREISKAHRYGARLSLLMFDVDDFKRVNDRHGHSSGDLVLEAIAQTCTALLREHDVLARYGGEEFVLLLPGTGEEGARQVAEKLRAAIEGMRVKTHRSETISITVSIGVSILREPEETVDTLFARADDGLYRSKLAGKNRWMLR